jgi:hypothetical protein
MVTSPQPFDERAALQELERLADKIQSTRRQRQEAVAEFEAFVKSFREERYQELIAAQAASAVEAAPARRAEPPPAAPIVHAVAAPLFVPGGPPRETERRAGLAESFDARPAGPTIHPESFSAPKRPPYAEWLELAASLLPTPRARLSAAAIAVVLLLLVVWMLRGGSEVPAATPQPEPAAAAPAQPQATPEKPVASTGPARALNVELVTLRPVWTRVIVDDQKTIERVLPQDTRLPLSADRTIAIRAGDAGAVRLTMNGKDLGPLGRDGQIGSRVLTAPSARGR